MNDENFDSSLDDVVDRYLMGLASEEEVRNLDAALKSDRECRQRYLSLVRIDANLQAEAREAESEAALPATETVSFRRWPDAKRIAALVAVLAAIFAVLSQFGTPGEEVRILAAEGVGSLDVRALNSGEELTLATGILELDLGKKARVVFEAPVSFAVEAVDRVRLTQGRCYAEMEKGSSGLRIVTPTGDVLDLGTRFGVEVPESGQTNVHVFEGAVEVGANNDRSRLEEGDGVRWSESGLESLVVEEGRFVQRLPKAAQLPGKWLHWSFDDAGSSSEVPAKGEGFPLGKANGTIHGATPIAGVNGEALRFDGIDDWVETAFAGIEGNRERTAACWMRVNRRMNQNGVKALIGWGHYGSAESRQSRAAWELSVRGNSKPLELPSRPQLRLGGPVTVGSTSLNDGKWHHVAAVMVAGTNGRSRAVLLYVDGQLQNRSFGGDSQKAATRVDDPASEPVQFGRQVVVSGNKRRYFEGDIDEMFLIERAMTGDQIRHLMNLHQMP